MNSQRAKDLRRNLVMLNIWFFMRRFFLFMPVLVPFLLSNNLTLSQVFLLESVYAIFVVALEIPTGYFTDVFSRKWSIVIGTVLWFLGQTVYAFGTDFIQFFVAEVIFGVSVAFASGAWEAMQFETLNELGQKSKYTKAHGKTLFYGKFSEAIAAICAGFLVAVSLRTPLFGMIGGAAIAMIVSFTLVEPKRTKQLKKSVKNMLKVFQKAVYHHPSLPWIIAAGVVISVGARMESWLLQPMFLAASIDVTNFGWLWTLSGVIIALGSYSAHWFENQVSSKKAILACIIMIGLGGILASMASPVLAVVFMFIAFPARGVFQPLISNEVQNLVVDQERASITSVQSFLHQLLFAVTGPFIGLLAETNLSLALFVTGAAVLLISPWLLGAFYKTNALAQIK